MRQKSPERRQAEVALFAIHSKQEALFDLAAACGYFDTDGPHSEEFLDYKDQFINFLRNKREKLELLDKLEQFLAAYESFAPFVSPVFNDYLEGGNLRCNSFLGRGRFSEGHSLYVKGNHLVLRVINPETIRNGTWRIAYQYFKDLTVGIGATALEQVISGSFIDGSIVSKRVPGDTLLSVDAETLNNIPQEHIDQMLENIIAAYCRGVSFDMARSNILYDINEGFGFIDYRNNPDADIYRELEVLLNSLFRAIKKDPSVIKNKSHLKIFHGLLCKMRLAIVNNRNLCQKSIDTKQVIPMLDEQLCRYNNALGI